MGIIFLVFTLVSEMKASVLILLLVAILPICQGEVGQVCTSKDQCGADECCEIVNIVVASRRRQALLQPILPVRNSGVCMQYKQEGQACVSYEVLNGYCGCAQGLSCRTVRVDEAGASKRGALPPGWVEKCIKNS